MKNLISAAVAAAILTGCTAAVGGSGSTSDGKPLSASGTDDFSARTSKVEILSPEGWTCAGTVHWPSGASAMSPTGQFPLKCSNGATGRAIYAKNAQQLQITVSFALSNGKQGQVTFGRTS